jgi:hypothetical protein
MITHEILEDISVLTERENHSKNTWTSVLHLQKICFQKLSRAKEKWYHPFEWEETLLWGELCKNARKNTSSPTKLPPNVAVKWLHFCFVFQGSWFQILTRRQDVQTGFSWFSSVLPVKWPGSILNYAKSLRSTSNSLFINRPII